MKLKTSIGLEFRVYELTDPFLIGSGGKWIVADQNGLLHGQYYTVDDAVDAWKKANDIS